MTRGRNGEAPLVASAASSSQPSSLLTGRTPAIGGPPDGRHAKLLYQLGRIDLLIVDDWAMVPLAEAERRDFLEICDARY